MNKYVSFKEDEMILREGELSPYMYYVVKGSAILYLNYKHEEEHILGVISEGRVFGETSLFTQTPSIYTAVAYEDVEIALITKDNVNIFVKEHPELAMKMFENMSNINRVLKLNLEMLIREVYDDAKALKRNDELKANIARYSVRGISAYNNSLYLKSEL